MKTAPLLKILFRCFLAVLLAIVLAASIIPKIFGLAPLTILTGSMTGTYNPGDLIIVQPLEEEAEKSALAVGDVVSFYPAPNELSNLTTHRIVDVMATEEGPIYTTKGDANASADPSIKPVQVAGKVLYHVPYVGYAATQMDDTKRELIFKVLAVGLLAYAAFMITAVIRPRGRRGADQPDTSAHDLHQSIESDDNTRTKEKL